jgi:hypothetical protein
MGVSKLNGNLDVAVVGILTQILLLVRFVTRDRRPLDPPPVVQVGLEATPNAAAEAKATLDSVLPCVGCWRCQRVGSRICTQASEGSCNTASCTNQLWLSPPVFIFLFLSKEISKQRALYAGLQSKRSKTMNMEQKLEEKNQALKERCSLGLLSHNASF